LSPTSLIKGKYNLYAQYNEHIEQNNKPMMEIKIIRSEFESDRTIGKMYLNGSFFCHTLEDTDRNLHEDMSSSIIKQTKIAKKTCIPYGRYRVILSYSTKLKRYLPLILDVPNWRGIRIHKGSGPEWSSGCPLVGLDRKGNRLSNIEKAEKQLIDILDSVNKTEEIYITIEKDNQ